MGRPARAQAQVVCRTCLEALSTKGRLQCRACIATTKSSAYRKDPRNKAAHGTDEYWTEVEARRAMLATRAAMGSVALPTSRRRGPPQRVPEAFLGDMVSIGAYRIDMESVHRQAPYREMMALTEAFEARTRQ